MIEISSINIGITYLIRANHFLMDVDVADGGLRH